MTEDELFAYGLLKMAETIHMRHTGAADFPDDKTIAEMQLYLAHRRDNWKSSIARTKTYDDAVKNLIDIAVFLEF